MATDIAFALGVMALLGERVPVGLKIFLTARAIVDDIAAVLVIAVFHTAGIAWNALGFAALIIAVLVLLGLLGARHPLTYVILGIALWLAVLASGIHATIAGVALAFTIRARTPLDAPNFLRRGRRMLDHFESAAESGASVMKDEEQQSALHTLQEAIEDVQTPLHRMEHALHRWVTFLIMPVFALANAGVVLGGELSASVREPVALGVILGLLFGKPIGITVASWLAVRSGVASLPTGVRWGQIHGAGWLGGSGFTMSLFVAGLAFGANEELLKLAKIGVLTASTLAAVIGSWLLLRAGRAA
jgi:Na+:H+ antiporter, NhaA family